VRNDDLQLLDILDKVIESISESDKQAILNNWISINYGNSIDYTIIWKISLVLILIILVSIYWNTRLSLVNKELQKARVKAEEATQIKSNFLANMSHEIRTPMNSIVSMTYLIKKKTVDKQQLNYINMIETASNALLVLIGDILDLSKIEAKKLKISKVNFNLIELLDNINNIIKIKADEKGLIFEIIYDKEDSMHVKGDSLRLTQILTNLTSNAVKFTNSGYIKLHVKQISEDRYRFYVCDTGIGLTQEQIARLFSSFTQADESITRKYGGTGLGLAISKELVELMNGKIWVESTLDEGSCFIFEIELKECDKEKSKIMNSDKLTFADKSTVNKKVLTHEDKKTLFANLYAAVSSRRPNLCEPIILEIEAYMLDEEDQKLFKNVKKLIHRYRFKEAKELLNAE
jgi:polar amino acid transport system substrate-binding protein